LERGEGKTLFRGGAEGGPSKKKKGKGLYQEGEAKKTEDLFRGARLKKRENLSLEQILSRKKRRLSRDRKDPWGKSPPHRDGKKEISHISEIE